MANGAHKASTHACRCPQKPAYVASKKDGGWLNTSPPGNKFREKDPRRIQNPITGGVYFEIAEHTPLLSGNGTGIIRGIVLGSSRKGKKFLTRKVKINWGQQKQMPPPKQPARLPKGMSPLPWYTIWDPTKVTEIVYYYAFNVKIMIEEYTTTNTDSTSVTVKAHTAHASGWIPATNLHAKTAKDMEKLRSLMTCTSKCAADFDKNYHRRRFHALPKNATATHKVVQTKNKKLINRLSRRFFTKAVTGKATDYLSRCKDGESPKGYVNLCYNLPNLTKSNGRSVGGGSCDTVTVDMDFYRVDRPAVYVNLYKKKNHIFKERMRFVYGAVLYTQSKFSDTLDEHGNLVIGEPDKPEYRYGWIARRALRAL